MARFSSDLRKFAKQLENKTKKDLEDFVWHFNFHLSDDLVAKGVSPIGDKDPTHPNYFPGLFVSNWQLGLDNTPTGLLPNVGAEAARQSTHARLVQDVSGYTAGQTLHYQNNTLYSELFLDDEWSKKVPAEGILDWVESRMDLYVNQALNSLDADSVITKK